MNLKINLLLIGIIVATSLGLSGCRQQEKDEEVLEQPLPDIIQLAPEATRSIGFTTVTVNTRNLNSQIVTTGEINANENRVFHINSFVNGRITQDNVELGDVIHQGQTLATIQNLEVAKIQADYVHQLHQNEIDIAQANTKLTLAQKNLEREKRLLAEGISPRKDYQQAVADATLANQALQGLKEHVVHLKSEAGALLGAYGVKPGNPDSEKINTESPVKAPRSGVVTKKSVTLGDMVTADTVMYEVADLSQIWLDIAIYPKDFSMVHLGQNITFTTDSLPGKTFSGRIDYLQPAANATSHTYLTRAFLSNPQGSLKPGMFGQAKIAQDGIINLPFLPETSIQRYGREAFVFMPLGNHRFHKQTIILGNKTPGGYLVKKGIKVGDPVIVQGSFALKAALLKNQFAEEE